LVLGRVVERTLEALEALGFLAWLCLVNKGMELLFLPAMTELTALKFLTAFLITCDKGPALPIDAEVCTVSEKIGLASEVLEVVSIDALSLVMLMIVRAPLRFKEEHVEVIVSLGRNQVMNQSHFDVLIAMSKRTKVPVLTDKILLVLLVRLREAMAKLCFVLISVVQALHSVVSTPASVLLGTLFSVSELAKF
jgi:hypothetical protein